MLRLRKDQPARSGDFASKVVSSRRAQEELGWEPKVSFEEGVRRYIEWFKAQSSDHAQQWEAVDADLAGRPKNSGRS